MSELELINILRKYNLNIIGQIYESKEYLQDIYDELSSEKRNELVNDLMQFGPELLKKIKITYTRKHLELAVQYDLELVKYIYSNLGLEAENSYVCEEASKYNKMDILKWLCGKCKLKNSISYAIKNKNWEMVLFIHENSKSHRYICEYLAETNNDLLKKTYNMKCSCRRDTILLYAIKFRNYYWIHKLINNFKLREKHMEFAAGDINLVIYLKKHNAPWSDDVFKKSKTIKEYNILYKNEFPLKPELSLTSAGRGFKFLKWFMQKNVKLDTKVDLVLARKGDFKSLKYITKNGFKLNECIITILIKINRFDIVKWATKKVNFSLVSIYEALVKVSSVVVDNKQKYFHDVCLNMTYDNWVKNKKKCDNYLSHYYYAIYKICVDLKYSISFNVRDESFAYISSLNTMKCLFKKIPRMYLGNFIKIDRFDSANYYYLKVENSRINVIYSINRNRKKLHEMFLYNIGWLKEI
jgi:hypothetical protein